MEWSGRAPAPPAMEAGISPVGINHYCLHCRDALVTSEMGHLRPMHSGLVPINVRCYSYSDIIVRRSEVTRRAKTRHGLSLPLLEFRAMASSLHPGDIDYNCRYLSTEYSQRP
jgi:hypothetical protein